MSSNALPSWVSRDIVACRFLLDASCTDSRRSDLDLKRLERWADDDVITLIMAEPSPDDVAAGRTPLTTEEASRFFRPVTHASTSDDYADSQAIESILWPDGARTQDQRDDVDVVLTAKKYVFVVVALDDATKSEPGGMLGHARQLKDRLNVTVLRPHQAVELVLSHIAIRDDLARLACALYECEVPDWVGMD